MTPVEIAEPNMKGVMSEIIIPRTGARVHGGRLPRTEDYVTSYIKMMRAQLRETFVSTPHGNSRLRKAGERVIIAPNGEKIRVVELPENGNQIEHGDHLHAHVRAPCVTRGFNIT